MLLIVNDCDSTARVHWCLGATKFEALSQRNQPALNEAPTTCQPRCKENDEFHPVLDGNNKGFLNDVSLPKRLNGPLLFSPTIVPPPLDHAGRRLFFSRCIFSPISTPIAAGCRLSGPTGATRTSQEPTRTKFDASQGALSNLRTCEGQNHLNSDNGNPPAA